MVTRQQTATTTVVEICSYLATRKSLIITNNGAATVYISQNKGTCLADGTPVPVNSDLSFVKADGDEPEDSYYAITSAGTADLRVIEGIVPPVPPVVA